MTQAILYAHGYTSGAISNLLDLLKSFRQARAKRAAIKSTIKELSRLTDRELSDLGIGRGDIYAIAHEDTDYARFADTNSNLKGWV